jgi:hypothetical protein
MADWLADGGRIAIVTMRLMGLSASDGARPVCSAVMASACVDGGGRE